MTGAWRFAALVAVVGAQAVTAPSTGSGPWKHAAPGRAIALPADHASHPDYQLEWWYYTGNLDAGAGRRFGYQLTFFRIGVDPAPTNPSLWTVRDLFMAHLAVTDVAGKRHAFAERVNRRGPGWAGAASDAYRVWNEDWRVTFGPGVHRLHARDGQIGIDLELAENRAAVLHGDRGYSRKGSDPGNASHYYSLTRMPTRGTIVAGGRSFEVTGQSWMDHEFGTSLLEPSQAGWDWFSIQLEDGRDLMLFQLRGTDGSIDPRSSGTLVEPDGRTTGITLDSGFRLDPGRTWTSSVSRGRYPVQWNVRLPRSGLDLQVTAALDNQELHSAQSTGVTYWEGAVDVSGSSGGSPVKGRGYLEMTGYAGRSMGAVLR